MIKLVSKIKIQHFENSTKLDNSLFKKYWVTETKYLTKRNLCNMFLFRFYFHYQLKDDASFHWRLVISFILIVDTENLLG